MNLALTCASRIHHVDLVQHISTLIQQKTLDLTAGGRGSDCYEPNATYKLTNQIAEEGIYRMHKVELKD